MLNELQFNKDNNINIYSTFRSLVIRFISIGLFVSSYLHIRTLCILIERLFQHSFILPVLIIESNIYITLTKKKFKSYVIITIVFGVLLPIYKSFMSEIASDTVYLIFMICQIIYCLDSVRIYILRKHVKKVEYTRSDVIPLEEALLIPKKTENNGVLGNLAAMIGFMAIFSTMNSAMEVLVLQCIGFYLYMYFPYKMDDIIHSRSFGLFIIFFALIICYTNNILLILFSSIFLSVFYLIITIFEG